MNKLPKPQPTHRVAQGIFLELLQLLVDTDIIKESDAVAKYQECLTKYSNWEKPE